MASKSSFGVGRMANFFLFEGLEFNEYCLFVELILLIARLGCFLLFCIGFSKMMCALGGCNDFVCDLKLYEINLEARKLIEFWGVVV